jgi:hypothetical protein
MDDSTQRPQRYAEGRREIQIRVTIKGLGVGKMEINSLLGF